jgi:hypothetical protein
MEDYPIGGKSYDAYKFFWGLGDAPFRYFPCWSHQISFMSSLSKVEGEIPLDRVVRQAREKDLG